MFHVSLKVLTIDFETYENILCSELPELQAILVDSHKNSLHASNADYKPEYRYIVCTQKKH